MYQKYSFRLHSNKINILYCQREVKYNNTKSTINQQRDKMPVKRCASEAEQNTKIEAGANLEGKAGHNMVVYQFLPIVTGLVFCCAFANVHTDVAAITEESTHADYMSIVFGAIATGASMVSTMIFFSGMIRTCIIFTLRIEPEAAMTFLNAPETTQHKFIARGLFLVSLLSMLIQEIFHAKAYLFDTRYVSIISVILTCWRL